MSGPDSFGTNPYATGSDLIGKLVMILRGKANDRGLRIEPYRSRALLAGEIHELMITDIPLGQDSVVDRVAILGFFELTDGGVATTHSEVLINGRRIGTILGFDTTHFPNHLNICVLSPSFQDGVQRGLRPGDQIAVRLPDRR